MFLLLLACGPRTVSPPAPGAAPLPPFAAAEIREGMPVGTTLRFERRNDEEVVYQRWEVETASETDVTIAFTPVEADGEPAGASESKPFQWEELESHAHFPAGTQQESIRLDTFDGTKKGWRYTVVDPDSGTTIVYEFARVWPGPPVRMEVLLEDRTLETMLLVDRDPR